MRRFMLAAVAFAGALAFAVTTGASAAIGPPQPDPSGLINLPGGFGYTTLATSCATQEQSTESGATFAMPEDPDGKALFPRPDGTSWLLVHHELTQPRPGDFQGDAGKCHVDEQTPGDDDSDGWGSVSRLTLAADGTTVQKAELITTGLHNLCASAITPWGTYVTNEEFPFINDPELRSGWAWEIDPATGAQTRLTGMGRFSHEQEALTADGSWYLTDDRGDARFIYRFIPDYDGLLFAGRLYGLVFMRQLGMGFWVGPLNPLDPDADMRARGFSPSVWGFTKAEGLVTNSGSTGLGGNAVYFTESGAGADPGRVWRLDPISGGHFVTGHVVIEGDWARLGRPDNLRFNDAGDLFVMEDHSSSDFARGATGNVNQVWVLPRGEEGSQNMVLFASTPDEPTGPWFSPDGKLLYLSVQADPPRVSRVIAIRHPTNFNDPYDQ